MTVKVNRFVKFLNSLSQTGRYANKQISQMKRACGNPVYQNRYFGNSIALLQKNLDRDCFCYVQKDGSKIVRETENKHLYGFKLFSSKKVYSDYGDMQIKLTQKQAVYNMHAGKIEEEAKKSYSIDGPSILIVRSAAERQSQFPSTELGGSIHPAVAAKQNMPNGDTVYIERYPGI